MHTTPKPALFRSIKWNTILLRLFFVLSFPAVGVGQCYVQLADYSGFDTAPYQAYLNNAACELIRSLPAEYQDQFGVYDFGFYPLNAYMDGGFEQVWQQVLQQVETQTPYYLVFGKESANAAIYSTMRVGIKLPPAELFGCPQKLDPRSLELNALFLLTADKNPYTYAKREVDAMNFLKQVISCREICGNDLDDDSDGWSDCNDPDCRGSSGVTLRSGPTCQAQAIFREHPEQKIGFAGNGSAMLERLITSTGFVAELSLLILEAGEEDRVNVEFSPGSNLVGVYYKATGVELLSGSYPQSEQETLRIIGTNPTDDAKIEVIDSLGIKIGELKLMVIAYEQIVTLLSEYYDFSGFELYANSLGNHYYDERGTLLYINRGQKQTDFIKIIDKYALLRLVKISRNGIKNKYEFLDTYFEGNSTLVSQADLTPRAWSKITTRILEVMPDVGIRKLNEGKIHVKDVIRNLIEGTPFEGQWDLANTIVNVDGQVVISVYLYSGECDTELHSVSNVMNCLGAHEFLGHAKMGYGDKTRNHSKAYEVQFDHYSWFTTTPDFKLYQNEKYMNYVRDKN